MKRFRFQCWNCPKVYSLIIEITDQEELIVTCPYCRAEAIVDLRPYKGRIKTVLGAGEVSTADDNDIQLPGILPTRMPGDATTEAPPPEVKNKKLKKK